ncbi:hypothetical protein EV383_4489 [Pseudonocardia sediminis]|uniref:Uncharacterized protein n=1 Tax=Pseudonocardia sediminis TaxID=1397368 RepID=A0A4Q7V257_PSEST|nr:hypothetical protein [Pseudonocardia sediminis]RZT87564.1 hypothetical protein EV383_4489 [Pseudonocardia sediminis]
MTAEITLLVRDGSKHMTRWTATTSDPSGWVCDDPAALIFSVPVEGWRRVLLIDPLGSDE